jgi:HlyD family secretion protein
VNESNPQSPRDIAQVLGVGQAGSGHHRRARLWIAGGIVLALAGAVVFFLLPGDEATVRFKTAEAWRGDLTVKVTATGVLEPVNQVEVGTEISGTIETVEVDYNDRVKRGQVLARLDTARLEAQVIQARASLASAEARLQEAGATVEETRLRAERCGRLARQQMCSQEELDTQRAAFARAQAAQASAKAQVAVAKATLDGVETDLAKAVIRAPIDGIVLKRQIEPGQTVAASLQTPVLFILAENLAQMELHVAVDEADVGEVKEGQEATFTVDAYPRRSFPAVITQVRFAPETVEGVVTYETVLTVDNTDLALRPGMTATADIIANRLHDVLLVPNAALRFVPPPPTAKVGARPSSSLLGSLFPRFGRRSGPKARQGTAAGKAEQRVWALEDGQPVAIPVTVGATDGQMTEVVSGDIEPHEPLLVDIVTARR